MSLDFGDNPVPQTLSKLSAKLPFQWATETRGHGNIRPPRQKTTKNISIIIQMPQTSGHGCRTVDYYKLRRFAQQKNVDKLPSCNFWFQP